MCLSWGGGGLKREEGGGAGGGGGAAEKRAWLRKQTHAAAAAQEIIKQRSVKGLSCSAAAVKRPLMMRHQAAPMNVTFGSGYR